MSLVSVPRTPLGKLLLEQQYIQEHHLKEALELQLNLPRESHMHLGEILVSLGHITELQLKDALQHQPLLEQPVIGRLLIEKGLLTEWQLSRALTIQFSNQHKHKKLGQILDELGYVMQSDIDAVLLSNKDRAHSDYLVF